MAVETSGKINDELKEYRVDLHIHSVLSPCGELEMGPVEIAERTRAIGLDAIALTDHNASANVPGLKKAVQGWPVLFPGMEVQTAEDIHVVALWPTPDEAACFQEWLWERLLPIPNDTDKMGYQLIVDSENEILDQVDTLLIQGVSADIDTVLAEIRTRGGISIMAHVDRPSFSYTSVLGPMPDDLNADAIELSWRVSLEECLKWREKYPAYAFLQSSDAHRLSELQPERCSVLRMKEITFDELKMALRGENGRSIVKPVPYP